MLRFKKPILTILGGMGPIAGLELHRKIIINTPALRDQDHPQIQHISFPNLINDRTAYLITKQGNNPGSQAGQLLKNVIQDNPSKFIVGVPCNTFHSPIIFNLFQSIITLNNKNIEIVNMVEATINYIENMNYKKIGLLCTNGTRQVNLYQDLISKKGLELCMIPDFEQEKIDDIIYNPEYGIKCLSYANKKVVNKVELILNDLINLKVDCIILGCSELPLAFSNKYYQNIEIINPVDILAKEMIKKKILI